MTRNVWLVVGAVAAGLGVIAGYAPILVAFFGDAGFRAAFIQSVLGTIEWQLPLPIPFPWTVERGGSSAFAYGHALTLGRSASPLR